MRKILFSILVLLSALPMAAGDVVSDSVPSGRKKVAVVLSGGGAFGAIHVGALRVIEQAGLPVDMLVGTSMGSIVGALYSVGYDSNEIAAMFRTMDWAELFLDRDDYRRLTLSERESQDTYLYKRDFYVHGGIDPQPGGVIRGNQIQNTFSRFLQGYTDSLNFQTDLPRRFACVATDLVTDTAVVLTQGSIVESIRASMSIPGVFTPVRIGDMVLVDGGAKNNFAADVARQLGADIVIGVVFDLGLGTDKEYRTLMDVLERSAGGDISRRARANEKYCDVLIKVPVRGYSSGSFTRGAINTLIERGEKAAAEKLDSLKLLKLRAGAQPDKDYSLHLRRIADLPDESKTHTELVDLREDKVLQAAVGLRFDNEDIAAAILHGRYFRAGRVNKQVDLTLRLGLRSMLRVGADLEPWRNKKFGLSYALWYKYSDLYTHGKRTNNLSTIYQHANLKLLSFDAPNFDLELGAGWEHYHIFNRLWNERSAVTVPDNTHYLNYHLRIRFNNENRRYFTTLGTRAEAAVGYYTDNFARWKGHSGFTAVTALWQTTIALSGSTHLRPGLEGRFVFGDDVPVFAGNFAGGNRHGKFFPQQLPLMGVWHVERFDNKFVSASLRLQQRIREQHYLLLDGVVAEHNEEMRNLFDRRPIWGIGLSYFYDSGYVGPLGATFSWCNHTHQLNFLISLGYDF